MQMSNQPHFPIPPQMYTGSYLYQAAPLSNNVNMGSNPNPESNNQNITKV
jgi:hypothetical protein